MMNRHDNARQACAARQVDNRARFKGAAAGLRQRQRHCSERSAAPCQRGVPQDLKRARSGLRGHSFFELRCRPRQSGSVIDTALALWAKYPHVRALEILDRAMQIHPRDGDLERLIDAKLEPRHPFAELVRRAFAPHLHEMELWLEMLDLEVDVSDPQLQDRLVWVRHEWARAIAQFSERYGLW
jgi:hypothetical protein